MPDITQTCRLSGTQFIITEDDQKFYEKMGVPIPTLCPEERQRRRIAWCNEENLYQRKCDLTGKPIISQLPPENPRPVYGISEWWSDAFDPLEYGKDFDFSRPFFEQWNELESSIPHPCVQTESLDINSEYTHHAGQNKNCYLIFHATYDEDCYYGYGVKKATNCVDVHNCFESELCYECVDVEKCYDLAWSQDCQNCSSSKFLRDCIGCMDCFMCVGLRNKQFCFMNEQLSEEEYKKRISEINTGSHKMVEELKSNFEEFRLKYPVKALQNTMVENSIGDHLVRCKNAHYCFDCVDVEDCKYVYQMQLGTKNSYDIYQFGNKTELCYECAMVGTNVYNLKFCHIVLQQVSNLTYCANSYYSSDCFGCYGLKRNKFCILNKQYTEEEYYVLRDKIIEHMKKTGEWGEFFPAKYSQSAYNESMAHRWFPLSKEEALSRGYRWRDDDEKGFYDGPRTEIADDISDAPEAMNATILICESTQSPYKIIPQELAFYKKQNLPLPRKCPKQRRLERMQKRNPRSFWQRKCAKTGGDIWTTYSPERSEIVYSEEAYNSYIYN